MVTGWILAVAALNLNYYNYDYGYGYGEESNEESNEDVALRRHRALVHRTVVFTNNLVALLRGPGSDEEQEQAAWRLGNLAWLAGQPQPGWLGNLNLNRRRSCGGHC